MRKVYLLKSILQRSLKCPRIPVLRLGLLWMVLALCCATSVMAQEQHKISGTVLSAKDNTPLPGINVIIKGTTRGTVTDIDGKFSLVVSPQDVIVVSFIGMETKEVPVGNQTTLVVNLSESTTALDEVVVTALGVKEEKRSLGYAVQEVKGDEIAQTQRPNFMASMQGRVAGLTVTSTSGLPGASTSMTLRGMSSLSGDNQPLIVVDGLPIENTTFNQHSLVSDQDNRGNDYTNRAADINPNDIESITVLKGPEAAALYGQQGGSGVIVITTKKGSLGAGRISYDNNFGFQKVYRFPDDIQNKYSLGNYGYLGSTIDEFTYLGPEYEEGTKFYDNVDKYFQTGFSQTHNISVEGGSKETSYRFSTNYFTQDGVVPTSAYDKLSTRLTGRTLIGKKLEATTTFNYIYSANEKPERGASGYLMSVLTWPLNENVSHYLNADGTRYRIFPEPGDASDEPDNPFFAAYKNKNSTKTNRIIGNMSLSYDPTAWLNVAGRFGADVYTSEGNTFHDQESSRGLDNDGEVENYIATNRLLNGQALATARKKFGDINTSLMLGGSFKDSHYEVNSVQGTGVLVPGFNSINNTAETNSKITIYRERLVSLMGRFSADYKDLLYLSITGRNDVSSTLPAKNRSFFYPSASVSFVFTELDNFHSSFLTYGKLRASVASVGKDAPPYKVKSSLSSSSYTGGGFAYGYYGGNSDLTPERATSYEFGTELKFFNGRAGLDLTWYNNNRYNQITQQRLSYGTGFIFGLLNGGDITQRGLEVLVTVKPLVKKDFEWEVLVNFTHSKSIVNELPAKVGEYYDSDTWLYGNARGSAFPSNLASRYTGETYDGYNWQYLQRGLGSGTAIGGYTYQRNKNGEVLINPASGLPVQTADFLPIGERNPDFTIGLTNSFTYKNLRVSFLLDIRKGGDVFNGNEMYLFEKGLSKRVLDRKSPYIFKGVLQDGNENSDSPTQNTMELTPYTMGSSFYSAFAESDFVERDINWLRLRDLTISYTIPASILGNGKGIRTASVFTTMTDLFMITNYTGADPMSNGTTAATGGAGAFGFDFGTLSTPRTFSFGVRVSL